MKRSRFWLTVVIAYAGASPLIAAPVTTPKQFFGFNLGDDYCLANYKQLAAYWAKLEGESDRLKVVKIGVTEEGRPQLMGIVTSPANHRRLARLQRIAQKLALAEGVNQGEARALANEGKAVVWIDGGLHATETLCAQMLMETLYQFLASDDAETMRILDDVIILFVHANPDGMDLVADWYMKEPDPKKRTLTGIPRLYQKYVGHDNNRDFYANTQAETKNMNRVLYHEWFPQIVYNHHQAGPPGTILFVPPFRDPFNYNIDSLAISSLEAVGAAMMQRFLVEGKPGATCRSGASYSTWANGGLRTTTYFHNMIGLLSETIGQPAPMQIPFKPSVQLPKSDYLAPVPPQTWHFRQSVDYSVTANKAVLDYASRHREQLLYNIWFMGQNAIERGNKDSWTITPKLVTAATAGSAKLTKGASAIKEFERFFRSPARRDPRGYVIPAGQPDFLTATKFVSTLMDLGVKVHRATANFELAGKSYLKGSYVVKCAQAYRAHVLDMFEPQDHPNDIPYPGAAPTPPYDMAGWTLAYQMGIVFDRVFENLEGPLEEVRAPLLPPPARVKDADSAVGFFLSCQINDSFRAVNQLLQANEEVCRLKEPFTVDATTYPPGTFFIARKDSTLPRLTKIAAELGTPFIGSSGKPDTQAISFKQVRIGLWDKHGGSMPSGWTRWLLERFEFPFDVVFTPELDNGGLRAKYDVLVFVDGATTKSTAPELRNFLEAGGTVLAIGSATSLASQIGLPVSDHLADSGKGLPREKFYVPPSVLRVRMQNEEPLAWGMPEQADVIFASSPAFHLPTDAEAKGLSRIAWFDTKMPLRSGWAWGQERLEGGVAIAEARVGKGKLVLFGPQILYRAQPHGTFKLFFNGIVNAGM